MMVYVALICASVTEYVAYTLGQTDIVLLLCVYTSNEIVFLQKCSVNGEISWNGLCNHGKYKTMGG